MPDAPVQINLSQFREPRVEKSYEPKLQKKPGTIQEWSALVGRMARHSEDLYRDARILRSKRADATTAKIGTPTQRDAERDFGAVMKRAAEHCRELARDLLATGMPREHLENYLVQCGMEHNRKPDYSIALLYCKLMGIEFEEQHAVIEKDEATGEEFRRVKTDRRKFCWAVELKPSEVDDFFLTMRTLSEQMPALAGRFRRGEIHL